MSGNIISRSRQQGPSRCLLSSTSQNDANWGQVIRVSRKKGEATHYLHRDQVWQDYCSTQLTSTPFLHLVAAASNVTLHSSYLWTDVGVLVGDIYVLLMVRSTAQLNPLFRLVKLCFWFWKWNKRNTFHPVRVEKSVAFTGSPYT